MGVDESGLDELFEPRPGCCEDCDELLDEHFGAWEREVRGR